MFRYLSKLVLFLSLLTTGAFAGTVTVSCTSPTANSTKATPVNFNCSATTTAGTITGWAIYDSGGSQAYNNPGPTASINTNVTLTTGTNKTVTVKAWDSTGASGTKAIVVTVTPAVTVTVNVSAPAPGASLTSPATFNATATTTSGTITAWKIYVDNTDTWDAGAQSSISAQVSFLSTGTHNVVVQAWSSAGPVGSSPTLSLNVTCITNCGAPAPTPTPTPGQGVTLNWSSSVKAETSNNTSANDNFVGMYYTAAFGKSNNVPAAANTSRVSLHTLLYPGHITKILMEDQPWFQSNDTNSGCPTQTSYPVSGTAPNGYKFCGSHPDIGVSSASPAHVKKLIDDLMARGVDGIYPNWYGPGRIEDTSVTAEFNYADTLGKNPDGSPKFVMSLNIDSGSVTGCAGALNTSSCKDAGMLVAGATIGDNSNCGSLPNNNRATFTGSINVNTDRASCYVTKMYLAVLYYGFKTYMSRPSYLYYQGRPVVSFFDNGATYTDGGGTHQTTVVDWSYLKSQATASAGNPWFLFREVGGFTHAGGDGAYGWIGKDNTPEDSNYDEGLSYLTDVNVGVYAKNKSTYPSKLFQGAAWAGFNNRAASWACSSYPNCDNELNGTDAGTFKITPRLCGSTFLDSIAQINNYYSTSFQLPFLGLNTWNDYEEGSELETGIDNCWTLNTPTIDGSKVLHWTLTATDPDGPGSYTSTPKGGPDGPAFAKITNIDHFTVFVSDGTLAADGTERLAILQDNVAVTEDTAGCKCFSLNLLGYNLPTATYHVYVKLQSKPFLHNSWDTSFVSYSAVGVANNPPTAALTLSPTTGAAPLSVTADVSGSVDTDGTIAQQSINWGDGSTASVVTGSTTTATHTYSAAGTYTVVNTATDNGGATGTASASVTVTAQGQAVAKMTVTPTSGPSPLAVTVDTSASQASPGATISSRVINWGDGSSTTTLTGATTQASHTYTGGAATYNLTLTINDSASKSAQVTQAVSVTTPAVLNTITIDTLADQAFVFSPVRVRATATAGNGPVTRLQIYVDSILVADMTGLSSNPAVIDKYVFLSVGSHHIITVQAYDAIGQTFTKAVTVFCEGTN